MKNYKAKNVTEFIASAAKEARPTLKELRKIVKSAVPKAEESISWGVPFYKYHGILAGFTPCKSYALFGLAFALTTKDRKALEKKGYKTGKKTVQIRFDQKPPTAIIKQMLKARVKINTAKKALK